MGSLMRLLPCVGLLLPGIPTGPNPCNFTRKTWSGRRGSNPHHQLGRLRPYHWTTPAKLYLERNLAFKSPGDLPWRPMTSALTPEPQPKWLVQTRRNLFRYRLAVGKIIPDLLPVGQAFFQLFSSNSCVVTVRMHCTPQERGVLVPGAYPQSYCDSSSRWPYRAKIAIVYVPLLDVRLHIKVTSDGFTSPFIPARLDSSQTVLPKGAT